VKLAESIAGATIGVTGFYEWSSDVEMLDD